jgi:hypothetical protein
MRNEVKAAKWMAPWMKNLMRNETKAEWMALLVGDFWELCHVTFAGRRGDAHSDCLFMECHHDMSFNRMV